MENIQLNKNKLNRFDKLLFTLYLSYFILKPFYFWNSGLPQISDFIMIIIITLNMINARMAIKINRKTNKFILSALVFIIYVSLVNMVWTILIGEASTFLLSNLFYIYNFFVLYVTCHMLTRYKKDFILLTYYAAFSSITIQFLIFLFNGGFQNERITGTFNNPNQLGYFTILILGILLLTYNVVKVQKKVLLVGIFLSAVLCLSSLSKASILSYMGTVLVYILVSGRSFSWGGTSKGIGKVLLIILALTLIITIFFPDSPLIDSVTNRLSQIGESSDDNLSGRGYDRIIYFPKYWIIGAGEGVYSRFSNPQSSLGVNEFHSTLGNIFFSYGIVGSVIFFTFLSKIINKRTLKYIFILFFIFIYGMTHNGIRSSLLWIIFSIYMYYTFYFDEKEEQDESSVNARP